MTAKSPKFDAPDRLADIQKQPIADITAAAYRQAKLI